MALGNFSGGLGFGVMFVLKDAFSDSADKIESKLGSLDKKTAKMEKNVRKRLNLIATGTVAAIGVGIRMAAQLSDQLVDVEKGTGLSAGGVEKLRKELEQLDTRRPLPELLELATLGGQLGESKDRLADFAKTADMVGSALGGDFGGNATEAVKKIGQLGRVFQTTQDMGVTGSLNAISSALNEMGNTGAANVRNVAQFAQKLGEMGTGMSASEAIGLGAALDELGVKTKTMASQFRNIVNVMGQSDENMRGFAKQLNMSRSEFKKMFDAKPSAAVQKLAESFKGVSDSEMRTTLKNLKLPASEIASLMKILSENTELVAKKQKMASKAMKDGTSVSKEFNKRNKTLGASFEKLQRNVQILFTRIGDAIGQVLAPFVDALNSIVMGLSRFAASRAGKFIIKFAGALAGAVVAAVALNKAFKFMSVAIKLVGRSAMTAMVALWPLLLIALPLAAIVTTIQNATTAFAEFDGTVKSGFGGFLQKLGGVLQGVKEIWSSWDSVNQEFSMSAETVEKLDKLGIRDLVVSIGTWVVRIKEFLKGVVDGFKKAWNAVAKILKPIFKFIGDALESIGIEVGKNTSATDQWRQAGEYLGYVLLAVFAALAIAAVVTAVAIIIAMIPVIVILGLIGLAIYAVIKVFQYLRDAFNSFWEWIGGLVDAGREMVQNIWEGAKQVFKDFAKWWWDSMKSLPGIGMVIDLGEQAYNMAFGESETSGGRVGSGITSGLNAAMGNPAAQQRGIDEINSRIASGDISREQADAALSRFGVDSSVLDTGVQNRADMGMGQPAVAGGQQQTVINPAAVNIQLDGETLGSAMIDFQNNETSRE